MAKIGEGENLKKLLGLRRQLKDEESLDAFKKSKVKNLSRTSKVSGQTFTMKGKPKTVSSPKVNFTMPKGGELVKASAKDIAKTSVKKVGKDLVTTDVPTTAKKVLSKSAKFKKFLGPAAKVAGRAAGPLGAVIAAADAPTAGEGSDVIPNQNLSIGDLRRADERHSQANPEKLDEKFKQAAKDIVISGDAEKATAVPLSTRTRNKVIKTIENRTPAQLEKLGEDAAAGKKKSLADNFTGTLMQFLPLAIGSLVGGLDVGVAAQEGANTAVEAQRKAGLEERKIAASEVRAQREREITPFQQQSLALRKRQADQVDAAEQRRLKGLKLNLDKFGLSRDQAAQLSEKQTESFRNIEAVTRGLERINDLKPKVNTGPVATRAQSAAELIGQASPEFTELKAETENNVAAYIKAISGAQASDLEVQRLKRVAPTINDDDETFKNKLNAYTKIINASKQELANAIKTGQPLKAGTIDRLIDKEFGKGSGMGREAAPAVAPTPEGKRERAIELLRKSGRSDEEIELILQSKGL